MRAGGGTSHRAGLSDAILLKDNHLAGTSITAAVRRARALWPGRLVEVECDALNQVAEAARAGADVVLLDNMDPGTVVEAIAVAHLGAPGPILTEVSGGVTLATVGAYAAAGPDRISVGALTHSAPVLDLGLDLVWTDGAGLVPRQRDRTDPPREALRGAPRHRRRQHRDRDRPLRAATTPRPCP